MITPGEQTKMIVSNSTGHDVMVRTSIIHFNRRGKRISLMLHYPSSSQLALTGIACPEKGSGGYKILGARFFRR